MNLADPSILLPTLAVIPIILCSLFLMAEILCSVFSNPARSSSPNPEIFFVICDKSLAVTFLFEISKSEQARLGLEQRTAEGSSPLHIACAEQRWAIVEWILGARVDVQPTTCSWLCRWLCSWLCRWLCSQLCSQVNARRAGDDAAPLEDVDD